MESRYLFILIFLLSLFDAIAINSSYAIVEIFSSRSYPVTGSMFLLLALLNLAWFFSALFNKLYRYRSVHTITRICYKTILTFCCQVIVVGIFIARMPALKTQHVLFFKTLTAELVALGLLRVILYIIERKTSTTKRLKKTIAVLGYNEISERLAVHFKQNGLSYNFAGHYPNLASLNANFPYLSYDHINPEKGSKTTRLDEVYTTEFPEHSDELMKVIEFAEKHFVRMRFIPTYARYKDQASNPKGLKYNLDSFYNGLPVLINRPEPLHAIRNRIFKRLFDLIFSLIVLTFLLSWLFPIISLIILLESRGPVVFKQLRSGRNNQPFWCYKFRSMQENKESNRLQASKNDPRVTRFGAFMRRTSIDELPQFFNVFLGEMSVVGPRPHMLHHTDEYKEIVDQYMVRLFLRPGITGWAQINGFRGETRGSEQMRARVEHDIWYMENWSSLNDIKIIYKTIFNTINGEENAF